MCDVRSWGKTGSGQRGIKLAALMFSISSASTECISEKTALCGKASRPLFVPGSPLAAASGTRRAVVRRPLDASDNSAKEVRLHLGPATWACR